MYRNAYQRGMLTIFFSVGSKPLNIWETHIQDGYITRFLDQDIKSMVLEIGGTNVSTTYMTCPKGKTVLGISMPFLVMIVKNLKKYFSFEVTILDETGTRRRFRVSNFQSTTQILPLCTVMPIGLSEGWNQIQFNLAEFTRRAYKKQFVEVQKLKINANIRLRRVYFTERLIPEEQLPPEYKLFFPLASKGARLKENISQKENIIPSTSQQMTCKCDEIDDIVEIPRTSSKEPVKRSSVFEPKMSKESIKEAAVSMKAVPALTEEVVAPTVTASISTADGLAPTEEKSEPMGQTLASTEENVDNAADVVGPSSESALPIIADAVADVNEEEHVTEEPAEETAPEVEGAVEESKELEAVPTEPPEITEPAPPVESTE